MLSDVILFIPFTCIYVSFHLISKLKDFVTRCDYAKGERGCERDQTSAAISDCQWVNCIISYDRLFLSHTVKVKSDSSSHYDLLIAFYVKAHLLYFISHFIWKQIFRVKTYALSLLLSASKDSRCMVTDHWSVAKINSSSSGIACGLGEEPQLVEKLHELFRLWKYKRLNVWTKNFVPVQCSLSN